MTFASPILLLGLLAAPLAVWGYLLLERRRAERAARWSSASLLPNMVDGDPGRRRHIPAVLFLLGLTLLLVGFARPEAKLSQVREGATVVLALDVSGSMGAKDVRPSRLGAAGAAAIQFARDLPRQYRIALVTFSNHAAVRLPPTYLHDELAGALPPKPLAEATALGDGLDAAIRVAQKAVGPSKPGQPHPPAAILLLSDGSQNAGQRLTARGGRGGAEGGHSGLHRVPRHARRHPLHASRRGEHGAAAGSGRRQGPAGDCEGDRRQVLRGAVGRRVEAGLQGPRLAAPAREEVA